MSAVTTESKSFVPVNSISAEDAELIDKLEQNFEDLFNQKPALFVSVPGRVNLIGEHVDYCGYSICPMALKQRILIAVAPSKDRSLKFANLDSMHPYYEGSLDSLSIKITPGVSPPWQDYMLCGVRGILETVQNGEVFHGMLAIVTGNILKNSGLSSSSALVCAAATAAAAVNKIELPRETLATLCAHCEHYIGTQGGGMDQAIAFLATSGCAKHIEFNPLRGTDMRLPDGVCVVIAHSLAELNKASTADFNCRVVECRLATQVLLKLEGISDWHAHRRLIDVPTVLDIKLADMGDKVKALLHEEAYSKEEICNLLGVTAEDLNEKVLTENTRNIRSFKLRQRALHVYEEAQRVALFCAECEGSRRASVLGELMNASHESLRTLYECSHPELDELVKVARKAGALGARLTGAGWGGCVVALTTEEHVGQFIKSIKEDFFLKGNRADEPYLDRRQDDDFEKNHAVGLSGSS